MNPVIEHSIVRIGKSRWLLGSSMLCDSDSAVADDASASWTSDSGKTFYLRKSSDSHKLTGNDINELSQADRVHKAGTSAAVWAFGGVHIKVKAWIPELQSESDTLQHVQKTSVPVPEVIFSWIDAEWNRSFLVMKSIKGRTLYQAWPVLTEDQKSKTAAQVASYCVELASLSSRRLETLSGKGVREDWLTKNPSFLEPSWKPFVQGPFTVHQLESYIQDDSISIGADFYFYHADLGPTNIILGDDSCIAAVIDWESAAFYPRFWIATKPLFSAGFNLEGSDRSAWAILLSNALERRGFDVEANLYRRWRAAVKE